MSRPFEKVTVVGTGTLGTQIAMVTSKAGYQVKAFDPRKDALSKTLTELRETLETKGVEPFLPWVDWEPAYSAITPVSELGLAVGDADLVIEVVPENLELKRQVFAELGRLTPPQTILATNSSSIPVSRMEEASGRPQRCLNLHFYMILGGQNMVDIMGGTQTLPEVIQNGTDYIRSLGCLPLTVNRELLGFCFNRVWRAIKREVLHMWAGGFVDFRDIDRGWKIFSGMLEGPFAFMDKIGLDVIYDIEMVYFNESKDPNDHPPQALKDMIERGELGVKSGRGFYSYPNPEYLDPDFMDPQKT